MWWALKVKVYHTEKFVYDVFSMYNLYLIS